MVVNHKDGEDRRLAAEFADIPKEEQFFHTAAGATAISAAKPRSKRQLSGGKYQYLALSKAELAEREKEFARCLDSLNVGLQQLSAWFNRKADGTMDMDLVHFRGEYNATDEALHTAAATKRGREELRNMGEALIANTYIMLCDYTNVRYERSSSDFHYYESLIYLYVFRIAEPDKLVSAVYDCWIDEGDLPEVKRQKKARFDSIKVKLELVRTVRRNVGSGGLSSGESAVSVDDLYTSMVHSCYNVSMDYLSKKDDSFGVQAPVYSVSPITAKIGKKEGLQTGQRYGIYESVMKKGKVKQVRRGYALATAKITDNRQATDGSTEPSQFLQVSGQRIAPGMTLRYRRYDIGMTFMGAYGQSMAGQGMWQARVESHMYNIANAKKMGWYMFADLDNVSSSNERPLLAGIDYSLLPDSYMLEEQKKTKAYRVSFGFGRQYQLTRNMQLSPYAGVGIGVASYATLKDTTSINKDISLSIQSWSAKAGVNLAVNLRYPLQLVGGAYVHANITTTFGVSNDADMEKVHEDYKGSENDPFAALRNKKYGDYYKDLQPFGVFGFVGLRYTF
jgi:hypothetical protein